jgi:hypothetical protein
VCDSPRSPRDKSWHLISLVSGGHSVGIICLWTKGLWDCLLLLFWLENRKLFVLGNEFRTLNDISKFTANLLSLQRFAARRVKSNSYQKKTLKVRHSLHNEFALHLLSSLRNVLKVWLQPRAKTLIFYTEETLLICRGVRWEETAKSRRVRLILLTATR